MKRIIMGLVCLMLATGAFAQQFTIGGKYSNYETELSIAGGGYDTDREGSLGFLLEYRNDRFVLKGQIDNDLESGLAFDFFDFADYERERIEISAGYGVTPNLDIDLAVRLDSLSVDGLFFDEFFGGADMDLEAIGVGAHFHSDPRADIGFFLMGRVYTGNAEFDLGVRSEVDTTGFRIEGGFPIRIGESNWHVVPGLEYERFETDDIAGEDGFEFETNRLVLAFTYSI